MVGTTIADRYRVEGVLGEGASAVVYAAHDQLLDRPVALKIPRLPLGSDDGAGERIAGEVRAAARLHDWHIVTIFDIIEDRGHPIIVMERVNGESLADLLRRRGTLPLAEVVAISEGIARALAAAHTAGIVHRDVKPSNVLLTDDGGVKLADFGVARALANEQARLTQTGMVVGSVFYLAPELMAGRPPSPAVDLYALGAVTYQMLRGEPPFTGIDPLTIALAHATQPVPSLRDVPGIPLAFAQLLERLLAKEPAERPADAGTVADEFATWSAALAATDPLAAPTVTIARERKAPPPSGPAAGRPRRARFSLLLAILACACLTAVARAVWPHDVVVPSVSGNADAAEHRLTELGLRVGRVSAASRTIPSGSVIGEDPQPGTHLAPGSSVRLSVSTGLPFVAVPNIVGRDASTAAATIRAAGLHLVTQLQPSVYPPNTVIEQTPAVGASLRANAAVIAVVSSGPGDDADEAQDPGPPAPRGAWVAAWCGAAGTNEQFERDKREIDLQQRQVDEQFDGSDPRERHLVKAHLEAQKAAIDAQERQLDRERNACEGAYER